jgi:hypothetical protein
MDQRLWVAYEIVRNVQQPVTSRRPTRSQRARVRDMVGRGVLAIAQDRIALSTRRRYLLVDHRESDTRLADPKSDASIEMRSLLVARRRRLRCPA